jgi:RNA polymerase sigma-70 factor (ECF subfamily)
MSAVQPDPLRDLLAAASEGDDHAFAMLVRETSDELLRFCARLGTEQGAEDLVQETYLRAVRGAGAFRGDSAVRTWLMGIARHVCADELRRTGKARRTLRAFASARLPRNVAASVESSWVDVDDQLLSILGREQREAFVLTRLMGWSYVEAAEALGCPVGTVRSRVARARAQLADVNRAWEAG